MTFIWSMGIFRQNVQIFLAFTISIFKWLLLYIKTWSYGSHFKFMQLPLSQKSLKNIWFFKILLIKNYSQIIMHMQFQKITSTKQSYFAISKEQLTKWNYFCSCQFFQTGIVYTNKLFLWFLYNLFALFSYNYLVLFIMKID